MKSQNQHTSKKITAASIAKINHLFICEGKVKILDILVSTDFCNCALSILAGFGGGDKIPENTTDISSYDIGSLIMDDNLVVFEDGAQPNSTVNFISKTGGTAIIKYKYNPAVIPFISDMVFTIVWEPLSDGSSISVA